jgi:hypothetical protein
MNWNPTLKTHVRIWLATAGTLFVVGLFLPIPIGKGNEKEWLWRLYSDAFRHGFPNSSSEFLVFFAVTATTLTLIALGLGWLLHLFIAGLIKSARSGAGLTKRFSSSDL